MSNINYEKQAQDYYGKAPIIILGSGASAAHGMSGMGALAQHLTEKLMFRNCLMQTWNLGIISAKHLEMA